MTVVPVNNHSRWDAQVKCNDQFTPAIREAIVHTRLEFDPLGSMWGDVGVRRSPVQGTLFGWNATVSRRIETPTLVIAGDLDIESGVPDGRNLYDDLPLERKVFVHVACASHYLVWENHHMVLLRSSVEWLRHGTFAGHHNGSFFVDTGGQLHKE
jgi:pimeloyl-ACP methyl ester carboxylesterase